MRWAYTFLLVGLLVSAIGTGSRIGVATAAQPVCLHGENEAADQVTRRQSALGLARHINTLQAQASQQTKGYHSLSQIKVTRPAPEGFVVKHVTDGAGYGFSVIDQTDPCKFGYFSDDAGVIYRGEVIR